jgi:hypothetical protein
MRKTNNFKNDTLKKKLNAFETMLKMLRKTRVKIGL